MDWISVPRAWRHAAVRFHLRGGPRSTTATTTLRLGAREGRVLSVLSLVLGTNALSFRPACTIMLRVQNAGPWQPAAREMQAAAATMQQGGPWAQVLAPGRAQNGLSWHCTENAPAKGGTRAAPATATAALEGKFGWGFQSSTTELQLQLCPGQRVRPARAAAPAW